MWRSRGVGDLWAFWVRKWGILGWSSTASAREQAGKALICDFLFFIFAFAWKRIGEDDNIGNDFNNLTKSKCESHDSFCVKKLTKVINL